MLFWAKAKSALVAVSAAAALVVVNGILFTGGGGSSGLSASSRVEAAVVDRGVDVPSLESSGEITWNSDLLGHWSLDDDKVAEAAGRAAGKVVGGVTWVDGRLGGAATFDGKGGHVQLPNSEALDKVQEGSYTIAAWFKPEDAPPGKDAENNANYGIVIKTGWHLGLYYSGEQKFVMTHWVAGAKPEEPEWKGAGTWEDVCPAGTWYHVAGVVDRAAGKVAIYLNGELKSEAEFTPNAKAHEYAQQPWRVGIGGPDFQEWGWSAKGSVDDVRIYGKALPAADLKALFEAAPKK